MQGVSELGARALESADRVIREIADANIIFLVAGLGGGTGAIISLSEELRKRFMESPFHTWS